MHGTLYICTYVHKSYVSCLRYDLEQHVNTHVDTVM